MVSRDSRHGGVGAQGNACRRMQLECRECAAVCERVVSPWRCVRSRCRYIYAFQDQDTTYFGCLYKVFSSELDLAVFTDEHGRPVKGPDPYGPLRVTGTPRLHCPVWVERAYEAAFEGHDCRNPGFLRGTLRQG